MAIKLSIPLPGPFVWMPGLPKVQGSTGLTGFLFVVVPVFVVYLGFWLSYAALWAVAWVFIILFRLIAAIFTRTPDEPIDEPSAYREDRR